VITTTNAKVQFVISNVLGYRLDKLVMVIKIAKTDYIVTQILYGHILVHVKHIGRLIRLVTMITNVQTTCFVGLKVQMTP